MAKKKMEPTMHQTFDTYKSIKALVAQGFKEPQAEVIVNTIAESREFDLSKLATKDQVNALAKDVTVLEKVVEEKATKEQVAALERNMATKADIASVMAEISSVRSEIAAIKFDILKWIIPFLMGIIIAILIK